MQISLMSFCFQLSAGLIRAGGCAGGAHRSAQLSRGEQFRLTLWVAKLSRFPSRYLCQFKHWFASCLPDCTIFAASQQTKSYFQTFSDFAMLAKIPRDFWLSQLVDTHKCFSKVICHNVMLATSTIHYFCSMFLLMQQTYLHTKSLQLSFEVTMSGEEHSTQLADVANDANPKYFIMPASGFPWILARFYIQQATGTSKG